MRRTRLRLRRLTLVALGTVIVSSVALAYLATNDVHTSYLGETTVLVTHGQQPTTLSTTGSNAKINLAQQDKKDYYKFQNLEATLTSQGAAVSGQLIAFSVQGEPICSATTDNHGVAKCDSGVNQMSPTSDFTGVPGTYTADFAGNGSYAPATATGGLSTVGDGNSGH